MYEIKLKINIKINISSVPVNLRNNEYYNLVKNKIGDININTWNIHRTNTNIYEFPIKKTTIKPVSRSFFKLWEMLHEFDKVPQTVLCLCEAPGGFIQTLSIYYQDNPLQIYTMSLDNTNTDVPRYSKTIIQLPNVQILNENSDGNIYYKQNIVHIQNKIRTKVDFITADGGFNEKNFNKKEQLHNKLFFCEVVSALKNQQTNGTFILKCFTLHTLFMTDLIFVLCHFYENVVVTKPLTSRPTNSEKYIICKNFIKIRKKDKKIIKKLYDSVNKINENTTRILNHNYTKQELYEIDKINNTFDTLQVHAINKLLFNIENNLRILTLDKNKKINEWFNKFDKQKLLSRNYQ